MKACWLVLLLLGFCGPAHADRDIVYSARYYTPPGSHRTSLFHIYRINPDGTGRMQLTFGTNDEDYPKWSQDGRQITFVQYFSTVGPPEVSVMNANGGKQHILRLLKDNVEPESFSASSYRLENVEGDYDRVPNRHILICLKTGQKLTLPVPAHDDLYDSILPMPGSDLVYAVNNHNSTIGVDYLFYRLNPTAGTLHYVTEGQFLAWSPDGLRFCMAPGRDTTPYERRKEPYPVEYFDWPDAAYRMAWFAPLYVRAAAGGKMKQLTPRLSYVTGADWRRGR